MSRRFAAAAALLALPAAVALSFSAFWRRQPERPEPAGPEPSDDERALLEVIGTYFALRNLRARYELGDVVVEHPEGLKRYPLQALADLCQGQARQRWPQVVGRYFAAPEERNTPLWPDLHGGKPVPQAEAPAPPRIPPITAPLPEAAPARREPPGEPLAADVPAGEPAPPEPPEARRPEPPAEPPAPSGKPPTMAERLAMAAQPPAHVRPLRPVRPVRPPAPAEETPPPAPSTPASTGEPPSAGDEDRAASEPPAPPTPARPSPTGPASDEAGDWAEFSALVQDCFRRHGMEATVEEEGVVARDATGRVQRFQVPGLHRVTHELRRGQWPRFVEAVFEDLLLKAGNGLSPAVHSPRNGDGPGQSPSEPPSAPAARGPADPAEGLAGRSLDEVRGDLAVQLYDAGALSPGEREATIYAEDVPGLLSALVWRRGAEVVRVPPAVVEGWGVGAEEVFVAALANLQRLRPPARRLPLAPGVDGLCWQGENEFAAAQALLLNDDPRCNGRFGAVLALPRQGLLVVCPLRPMPRAGDAYPAALTALIQRILQSEHEGQEMLSRRLYWLRGGRFSELPYKVRSDGPEPTLELYPPDAFLAALSEMGGEAAP